jgi:hypothetical protein
LEKSLEQMIRVNHTIGVLTKLRNEVFSYDNKEHVNMLEQVRYKLTTLTISNGVICNQILNEMKEYQIYG